MGSRVEEKQDYGRRLLPHIVDDVASESPDRIVYSIVNNPDDANNTKHITASAFAKAIDKTAWWLSSFVGAQTSVLPVGYIGPHDLRHVLLSFAACKAGCTTLSLSPKNNVEGALAVLEKANCNVWIDAYETRSPTLVDEFLKARSMQVLRLPKIDELLDAASTPTFPYTKTFAEVDQEPFCMLHTSGTTGVPKPISWTHALIGTMDAVRLLPPVEGDGGLTPWTSLWHKGDSLYSSFPMSHGAGIIMDILMPALFDLRCVLGPVGVLPNMNLVEKLADHAKIDIWSMVPSLVDELGDTPDVLAKFNNAKFICASGGQSSFHSVAAICSADIKLQKGPVNPEVASKVNEVVRVLNLTGTTEGLFIGNLVVKRQDWHWFAFHPYSGFEFKEIEPGVFEHWIHRNEHWELFQGIFQTFPDKDSINLKDLYIQHPSNPHLWAFKGRSDDVVVLSNGYKISPLVMETFISTHPAINGCVMIGTGKTRAGLLVELKAGTPRKNELFDSIWAKVQEANAMAPIKSRLPRNDVAFADNSMPFVRTDKGTVKRHATVVLYTDIIERFYKSREDEPDAVDIDTKSVESIIESLRSVLAENLPAITQASADEDLFDLGLDSLSVFRTVNAIRTSMGIRQQLAPRDFYANPTLSQFASVLARITFGARTPEEKTAETELNDEIAKLRRMAAQQKSRLSFKMNSLDYVNPNHYMGINLFFRLRPETSFDEAYLKLQKGLHRALRLIPSLDGQMTRASEREMGYKKGDLRLVIPPVAPLALASDEFVVPRQLKFADLSQKLPSFDSLQKNGFLPSATPDDLLLPCNPFPEYPFDIIVAQANFVEGGCILATNFHHGCLDAVGVMVALKAWAESCKFIDGDKSATCDWLDPESANHSLPEILHDLDVNRRQVNEVDPNVWGFLPFYRPEELKFDQSPTQSGVQDLELNSCVTSLTSNKKPLTAPQTWTHGLTGFPPPADPAGRSLRTAMFLMPADKLELLRQEVVAETNGSITSISDIVQAFFWRVAIRARHRVAVEIHGATFPNDETAVLELPVDGRPHFSPLLPLTYMGSMLIMNRAGISLDKLCSPKTSVAEIAIVLREAAARITPCLFSDCFTLLRAMPHYEPKGQFSLADMGLDGMHAMISNMILFQPEEISFGEGFFAQRGSPEALRPQIQRGSNIFRFLVVHPLRSDGGVELVLGTLPEELEMLQKDEELARFATLADY